VPDSRFFKNNGPFSIKEIAAEIDAEVIGNESVLIKDLATLSAAGPGCLAFLANKKYVSEFKVTKASACICSKDATQFAPPGITLLVSDNPYYAYALVTHLFYAESQRGSKIAKSAIIPNSANIKDCSVGEFTVIGENVEIGSGCFVGNNVNIGDGVVIGDGTIIKDGVTITNAIIGSRCLIYSGARIGQDGFGFAPSLCGIKKVLQLGRVIIEDNVEIGANSTIDRGAIEDTIIGSGTKIDNLVQIGHNVKIGKNCFIVAQVGIAGSTEVGNGVMIGGQAGLSGHIKIGDGSMISGQSGVISDLEKKSIVGGLPALPVKQWHRMTAILKKMAQKNNGDS
jgi:UDP-3-O-[3-hydroxymyristoyl] glucosamine N-acyltransferase